MSVSNSIWINLIGAEVKFLQGAKYRSRILEAGHDNPEALVLIHGGGGHIETFTFNAVPLAEHFHVVCIEMLWHGLSDAPPLAADRNAQVADQILDVADTLGLGKFWLHGEAGGASAVTPIVLNHPDRIKGAIFESGWGGRFKEGAVKPALPPVGGIPMGERTLQLLKNATWQGVKDRLVMVMHRDHPERVPDELVDVRLDLYSRPGTNDGQTRYYTASTSSGASAQGASEEDMTKVDLPVLVLWSDGSGGVGPDAGERLASLIPGAQFKVLPETGFWAHWESPDLFNEAVRQFITGEKVT